MLRPRSEDVSLLIHAGIVSDSPGNGGSGFPARQTGGFRFFEFRLKFGISFAPLAVCTSPDWGICGHTIVHSCATTPDD
jgi:hypothetical protein